MTALAGASATSRAEAPGEDQRAVLAAADLLYDEATVNAAYDGLAARLSEVYGALDPLVLMVMTGGFVPAAEILKRVAFPFELDYIHATRYRNTTSGKELVWKRAPQAALRGRDVLVIDDILDEGYTLAAVRVALEAKNPASLRVAVLADKHHDRRAPGAHAEFTGLTLPDRYVFGCGMDYHGCWRQLPAIYAVHGL